MKAAIVALTRGYPGNRASYNTLLKRNNSIYENINSLRETFIKNLKLKNLRFFVMIFLFIE